MSGRALVTEARGARTIRLERVNAPWERVLPLGFISANEGGGPPLTGHDMRPPASDIVEPLLARLRRDGDTPGPGPVCLLEQLTTPPGTTCSRDPRRGWCLAENTPTSQVVGTCRQALHFSPKGTPLNRARVDILCAESRGIVDVDAGR